MVTLIAMVELLLSIGISVVLVIICLILNNIKGRGKNVQYIVLTLIVIFILLVTILTVINGILWFNDESLHLGLILGLPALILITTAMILVLYDEPKYVFWHGLLGISSWILTMINVIALFWLSNQLVNEFSGLVHFVHIIGGGGGLAAGFANALFGTSGQRHLAKVTGFITLGCWWTAFLLGIFLL
ncbi:MAG: hypothetical protein ACXABO_04315 [Promethearchaeota archaeon]|jgi:hypothetical protein